jgi:hypothetical protein
MPADPPDHFCPGCGAAQRAFARYPWYFCQTCLAAAVDGTGRALRFGNTDFGGGFWFGVAGTDAAYVCSAVRCTILGRPVVVHEARFGGVVAEPVPDRGLTQMFPGLVDLCGTDADLSGLRQLPKP